MLPIVYLTDQWEQREKVIVGIHIHFKDPATVIKISPSPVVIILLNIKDLKKGPNTSKGPQNNNNISKNAQLTTKHSKTLYSTFIGVSQCHLF